MTEGAWIAIIMGIPTILALIGGALAWVVNLVSTQSRDTISALREERDYWRAEAKACRDETKSGT